MLYWCWVRRVCVFRLHADFLRLRSNAVQCNVWYGDGSAPGFFTRIGFHDFKVHHSNPPQSAEFRRLFDIVFFSLSFFTFRHWRRYRYSTRFSPSLVLAAARVLRSKDKRIVIRAETTAASRGLYDRFYALDDSSVTAILVRRPKSDGNFFSNR